MEQGVELPLAIEHGAWIGRGLWLLGVVAVLGVLWTLRKLARMRAAMRHRGERAKIGSTPDVGVTALRGILRGGAIDTRAPAAGHWLDCDGVRVDLANELSVTVGSRERSRRGQLVGASVREGDEIVVHGSPVRRVTGEADYRADGATWVIRGALVEAWRPSTRPLRLHPLAFAALTLVTTFAVHLVLDKLGRDSLTGIEATPIRGPGDLARYELAATMPDSRELALNELSYVLDRHRNVYAFEVLLRVTALRGACRQQVAIHEQAERFAEALAIARTCERAGDRIGPLLVKLGHFAEAAPLVPPSDHYVVEAQILAGRWREAADALAVRLARDQQYGVDDEDLVAGHCLRELLLHHAGDATARDRLQARANTARTSQCAFALAEATPAPGRFAAFDRTRPERPNVATLPLWIARAALDGQPVRDEAFIAMRRLRLDGIGMTSLVWLGPTLLARWQGDASPAGQRMQQLARSWLAAVRVTEGKLGEARVAAAGAFADDGRLGTWSRATLEAHIARRTPVRHELETTGAGLYCRDESQPPFHAAFAGDGEPLVEALETCDTLWTALAPDILAVIPRVQRGRARLLATLRSLRRDALFMTWTDYVHLGSVARDIAILGDDAPEAQRWREIVARHAAALLDRDRAIALALYERLFIERASTEELVVPW